jgi:hypothetical protein
MAKEVSEGDGKVGTLDVVGEFGVQEVVDDPRAGGGDASYEAERAADLDGGGRGHSEEVCGPVEERCKLRRKRAVLPSPQFGFRQWFTLHTVAPSELGNIDVSRH